jgi:hypothetical protein
MQIAMMLIAFTAFSPTHSFAQLTPVWNQNSYPSTSNAAKSIKTDASGIYIGGFDFLPGSKEFRLEKRDLNTGALITGFGTGGVITSNPTSNDDEVNGVAVDMGGVYITGTQDICLGCNSKWRIEKRNLTTGVSIWSQISDPGPSPDGSNAITVDSSGVYIVGTVGISFFNWAWRVEKRDLFTGDTIWTKTIDVTFAGDSPLSVTADPSGIYVAGAVYDTIAGSGDRWRIEKRDLTTGSLIWVQSGNGERAQGITNDTSGIYVVGDGMVSASDNNWRIEKRNLLSGTLIPSFGTGGVIVSNPSIDLDNATGVSSDQDGIYISGIDYNSGDVQWRIEQRDLNSGALICTAISNPSANVDNAYAITSDTSGIYIAGTDLVTANDEWRIEKYNRVCNNTSSLAEEKFSNTGISIFPNPFSSTTTLQLTEVLKNATITIYNSFGQEVEQINYVSGQTVVLSRNNLPVGLYFIRLAQNNKLISTNKLLITN